MRIFWHVHCFSRRKALHCACVVPMLLSLCRDLTNGIVLRVVSDYPLLVCLFAPSDAVFCHRDGNIPSHHWGVPIPGLKSCS